MPSTWGPVIDSLDYELMIQNTSPVGRPISVVGHTLGSPGQDLSDPLTYSVAKKERGRIVVRTITKRAAQETGRTYQIGIPSSLMTPVMIRAERGQRTTFYSVYLCAEDSDFDHAYIYPDATLTPPIEAEDPITVEDTVIQSHTTDVGVGQRIRLWNSKFSIFTTLVGGAATALLDVANAPVECNAEDLENVAQAFHAVGGNTSDSGYYARTSNRWSSVTAVTTIGAGAGDYNHAVYDDGGVVIVTTNDAADLSATAGTASISAGGGAFIAATGLADPVYALAALGDLVIGVGKGGTVLAAGPSGAHVSDDRGGSWTEIESSALGTANVILVDIATDEENEIAYAVGTDSVGTSPVLLTFRESGGAVVVSDISSTLSGLGATGLNAVEVLGEDRIAIGGPSGFYAESEDGADTWSPIAVGTTNDITSIAGTVYRTVVGAEDDFFYRDVLNDNNFRQGALEAGQTLSGNITRIRRELEDDPNYFIFVTDDGEVVLAIPPHPWA